VVPKLSFPYSLIYRLNLFIYSVYTLKRIESTPIKKSSKLFRKWFKLLNKKNNTWYHSSYLF